MMEQLTLLGWNSPLSSSATNLHRHLYSKGMFNSADCDDQKQVENQIIPALEVSLITRHGKIVDNLLFLI